MEIFNKSPRAAFIKKAGVGVGTIFTLAGLGKLTKDILEANEGILNANEFANFAKVDGLIYRPEATDLANNVNNPTIEATPQIEAIEPTNEKVMVDKFVISEKINLASGEPMKLLFITNTGKTILTPSARTFAYSETNDQNGVFDWFNYTTYSYLENHNLPILWGHSGNTYTIFDSLANEFVRMPNGTILTRAEAESSMITNLIGSKVYLIQASREDMLPKNINNLDYDQQNTKIVEAKIVASLLFPRFITVDQVDSSGNPTNDSVVTFDGTGHKVDWIAQGYERHTIDFYDWIKRSYPDSSGDSQNTNRLFSSLPNKNIIGIKTCILPQSDDPKANSRDANGNPVLPTSYGRLFLALEVI